MVVICRAKDTGKIVRLIEFTNTILTQKQLDEVGLNNNYYTDYFFGEIEHLKSNED